MANTFELIASSTVGAGGATSVSFSSIPQTYTDLVLKISSRTNRATVNDGYYVRFNSSTTGYSGIILYGNGSSAVSSSGTTIIDDAASSTASTFSNAEIYIPNYTSSNYKSYSVDSVMENNATTAYVWPVSVLWANTAAITSIQITPDVGPNFVQYSTAYLYGVKNA